MPDVEGYESAYAKSDIDAFGETDVNVEPDVDADADVFSSMLD